MLREGREDDMTELKERVSKLEAAVAEMRKALLRAGGAADSATEIKQVREVARLRCADLLQRAQNTLAILREVRKGKAAGGKLLNQINDLNNNLTALWMTVAGYGLGRDPYLDNVQVSAGRIGCPTGTCPGPPAGPWRRPLHTRLPGPVPHFAARPCMPPAGQGQAHPTPLPRRSAAP
jgi:hypothetical protein